MLKIQKRITFLWAIEVCREGHAYKANGGGGRGVGGIFSSVELVSVEGASAGQGLPGREWQRESWGFLVLSLLENLAHRAGVPLRPKAQLLGTKQWLPSEGSPSRRRDFPWIMDPGIWTRATGTGAKGLQPGEKSRRATSRSAVGRCSQKALEPLQCPFDGQCVGSPQAHQAGLKLQSVWQHARVTVPQKEGSRATPPA